MKKTIIIATVFGLMFIGCGAEMQNNDSQFSNSTTEVEATKAYEQGADIASGEMGKTETYSNANHTPLPLMAEKIIKEGKINLELDNYKDGRLKVDEIIKSVGGYVADEKEYFYSTGVNNNIVIRVANENFDLAMNNLCSIDGDLISKSVSSTEVTQEYVDIQSRMKAKQEVLARYYEILNKSGKITDILAVEDNIKYTNEELEQLKGRLNYLANKTSYSTINLKLSQTTEDASIHTITFTDQIKEAFSTGYKLIELTIIALVYIWPLLLLLSVAFVVLKIFRYKRS